MTKQLLFVLAIASLAACSKDNPYYCEGNPDDNCMIDAGNGGGGDVDATEIDAYVPECTTSAQCTSAAEPVCGADQTCRTCVAHSECTISNACLPSGACGDDATVAYVSATGDDAKPCTKAEPCKKLSVAATKGKAFVKVESNLDEAVTLANTNVTVLAAPGTQITRTTSAGPIVEISGTSSVVLHDLVITGGLGTGGHGIAVGASTSVNLTLERVKVITNGGNGLNVQSGTLKLARTVISGNAMGGANINANFDITNSMFVSNGSANSTTGGLTITPQGTGSVFRFNTVASNSSSDPSVTVRGMNCAFPFTSSSILISNNQVAANCMFEYSLFPDGTAVTGTNREGVANFKSSDGTMPLAANFFRIDVGSEAIGGGEATMAVMTDIDGDSRPQGGARDIGADEYK